MNPRNVSVASLLRKAVLKRGGNPVGMLPSPPEPAGLSVAVCLALKGGSPGFFLFEGNELLGPLQEGFDLFDSGFFLPDRPFLLALIAVGLRQLFPCVNSFPASTLLVTALSNQSERGPIMKGPRMLWRAGGGPGATVGGTGVGGTGVG